MGHEHCVDFVHNELIIKINNVKIDKETLDMHAAFGMSNIFWLVEVEQEHDCSRFLFDSGRRYCHNNSHFIELSRYYGN